MCKPVSLKIVDYLHILLQFLNFCVVKKLSIVLYYTKNLSVFCCTANIKSDCGFMHKYVCIATNMYALLQIL